MRPIVLTMLLAFVLVGGANAQPVISLSSSDLAATTLGDTITVDVMLTGLSAGDMLELLAAEVGFDDLHFGMPTVTSGGIIPDVAGFESDEFADLAGATFDSLDTASTTDMITANGVFFSFDISAISIGSGQISLDFADALGEDSLGNLIDGATAGAALSYSIFYPGDFDTDGDVDGDDFLVWQTGFGIEFGADLSDGDADGDGDVDGDDFLAWQGNFGSGAGAAAAGVPEPTSAIVACLCGLIALGRWHFQSV